MTEIPGIIKTSTYEKPFQLVCPICGSEWGHIVGIEDIDSSEFNYGVARILVAGETCGHAWSVNVGSHKGNLWFFIEEDNNLEKILEIEEELFAKQEEIRLLTDELTGMKRPQRMFNR